MANKQMRLYSIWHNMRQRCYSPKDLKYKNYGGRGITVCDEWKNNFKAFAEWALQNGYSDPPVDADRSWIAVHGLTIDRIDSDKGYSPENCRWVTFQENRENRKANYHYTHPRLNELVEWTKDEAAAIAEQIPKLYRWENENHKANAIRSFTAFLVCRNLGVRKMNMIEEEDVPRAKEVAGQIFELVRKIAIANATQGA